MLYLTCTTITSVDLAHYGVSHAKDWVSVDCGTKDNYYYVCLLRYKYFVRDVSDKLHTITSENTF